MTKNAEIMLGLELPDVDLWSDRVAVALGQNPGPFTGPGTNSYLIGTGSHRILLDPGEGAEKYLPVLEKALDRAGCEGIQEIVVTHAHHDHMGGVASVLRRFGPLKVSKRPWPGADEKFGVEIDAIDDGAVIRTENATLRAIHTPGHSPDHLSLHDRRGARADLRRQHPRRRNGGDSAGHRRPPRLHELARTGARGGAEAHLPGPRTADRGRTREDPRVHRRTAPTASGRSSPPSSGSRWR